MSSGTVPPTNDSGALPPVPPDPISYAGAVETDPNAKMYGMLCHLLALSAVVGVPFGHILGPLVMWLIKRDQYPFVNDQGKEALNFQITVTIALAISAVLILVVIGFFLMFIVIIAALVMTIIATREGKQRRVLPVSGVHPPDPVIAVGSAGSRSRNERSPGPKSRAAVLSTSAAVGR